MGGVDKLDQYRSYYNVGRSGKKWWRYIFYNIFNIALINSYIIYKKSNVSMQLSLKTFKRMIYIKLMNDFNGRKRRAALPVNIVYDITSGHKLVAYYCRICVVCKKEKNVTKSGLPIKTSFHCPLCNVSLCKTKQCFRKYHDSNS